MIIAVILLALICLVGIRFSGKGAYFDDYIGREQTSAVNGIFTALVFISHFSQNLPMDGALDAPYMTLRSILGQLVVASFLFYSGYGVCCSVRRKGMSYVKRMPWDRIFRVLLHFDAIVLIYYVVGRLMGADYTPSDLALSMIGWRSVGNSNWYIFAVLVMYAITFLSYMVFRGKGYSAVTCITVLSAVYVVLMQDRDTWWYNTIFCYAAGMWYALLKEKMDLLLEKRPWLYWTFAAGLCAAWVVLYLTRKALICYELHAIVFVLVIVMFCRKVKIGNPVLEWLGKNVFWIYVVQRLPMALFRRIPAIMSAPWLYFALSLAVTLLLSAVCGKLFDAVDKRLFVCRQKN